MQGHSSTGVPLFVFRARARLRYCHRWGKLLVNVDVGVVGDGDGSATATAATCAARGRYAGMLSFQKLDVYRCSIEFVGIAMEVGASLPRGHAELRDQLRRAALSVPLNIAEGAGRASEADGARHFAIARGSAMECAAVLDIIRALGALQDQRYREALDLLARVVAMLTKLCR
jgi:four helix bundle protein